MSDVRAPGHVYVIDKDYRVVYLDQAALRLFPAGRLGSLCYERFRGLNQPCDDCPCHFDESDYVKQTVVFSARLDQWFEITCLKMEWFDNGPCTLVSGRAIDNLGRNLFTALQNPSLYDELFELDISNNTYKILYNEPDKYVLPAQEGTLTDLYVEVSENMIHPDDQNRFRNFWDLDTLSERLEATNASLSNEFRKLTPDGSWKWVSQTVALIKRGGTGDAVALCFITDIDQEVRERESRAEDTRIRLLRERDQVTGLYNTSTFYRKVEQLLTQESDQHFEVLYLDIEHFRIYNEWHGLEAGNRILKAIARVLESAAEQFGGVAGYLGGDDFVAVVPRGTITEERIEEQLRKPPFDSEEAIGLQIAFGVSTIDWPTTSVVTACDHAMTAMTSVKGVYEKRVAWYEATMTEVLESEAKILLEVKQALKNREFILYWQPQCSTHTGRIVGLEALVRWQHPEKGLVMPGAFIPALERNGFIASLDLYVWEEACRQLREWLDRGKTPIPVSVNISRADLYAIDVPEALDELVNRYNLDHSLLELEITESSYAEDGKMAETVNRMKELGFTILMDDFGSGYSSLNMLKDIRVDILKIDMGFLSQAQKSQRSKSILETIVSMAGLMELRVIAEGTETEEQVMFLRSIGCNYAQGYHFYKPMDTASLEKLFSDKNIIDYRGVLSPEVKLIEAGMLLRENEMNRNILDNLLGGIAIYAVYDNHFELQQINNEYYRVTGCNPVDLRERQSVIWKQVYPDDLPLMYDLFDNAQSNPTSGATGVIRRYRLNGSVMRMKLRMYFLSQQDNRRLFYAAVEDVTEQQ